MKMRKAAMAAWGLGLAGSLLGACDGGSTGSGGGDAPANATRPAAPITVANPFHDGLIKLDELQRGAALRRAIRTAKETCDRVESSAFQQDHGNLKMWVATCQRTAYAVFLAPNGDVQVRQCADMATLKLPACSLPEAAPAKS